MGALLVAKRSRAVNHGPAASSSGRNLRQRHRLSQLHRYSPCVSFFFPFFSFFFRTSFCSTSILHPKAMCFWSVLSRFIMNCLDGFHLILGAVLLRFFHSFLIFSFSSFFFHHSSFFLSPIISPFIQAAWAAVFEARWLDIVRPPALQA